jgi:hypothetical protein
LLGMITVIVDTLSTTRTSVLGHPAAAAANDRRAAAKLFSTS